MTPVDTTTNVQNVRMKVYGKKTFYVKYKHQFK